MNDFERKMQEALKSSTAAYRPADPHAAKQRFMSRFRRRRLAMYSGSAALAGAAAVAAFLLLPSQVMDADRGALPPAAELVPHELTAIEVGGAPTDIAFGGGVVWIANGGLETIQRVGPLSNEVGRTYSLGGSPDGVAVGLGAAWVSDASAGTVRRIPFEGNDIVEFQVGDPETALDVAPGAGAVWVVAEDQGLFRIDADNVVTPIPIDIEGIADVAAGQGKVVVAGARTLAVIDPETLRPRELGVLEPTSNRDLQMSEGAVWVADGDRGDVTRYDLETGRRSDAVFVGGDFTAIASGEDAIWIISGNEGDEGNLTRLDPQTAELLGGPVSIGGHPIDVTTGAGSVWVISVEDGTVTRIDPNAMPNN